MPNSNPYLIAGSLPWGAGGGGMFDYMSSSNPEKALASHYAAAYNSALDMNRSNYNNILAGYQQMQLGQMGGMQAVNKGYKTLLSDVMQRIGGVGKSERQGIADQYAAAQGDALQNLVGSGLGNSTVTSSVARGLTLDEAKANNQLAEKLAQMMAGYQSNIGQARLSAQERGFNQRNANQQQQLNWMNSIQSQYPDASTYAQLAQGLGAAKQARADADRAWATLQNPLAGVANVSSGGTGGTTPAGGLNPFLGTYSAGGGYSGGALYGGQQPNFGYQSIPSPGGYGIGPGNSDPGLYSYSKGIYGGMDSPDKGTGKGFWGSMADQLAGGYGSYKGSGGIAGLGDNGGYMMGANPLMGIASGIAGSIASGFMGQGGLWGGS